MKFAPSGGHVRAPRVPSGSGQFEVRVHDSGPGVAPEDVDRIFEAFTASGPDHGFGVGLAFARRYAEMHHGGR